mmetsp:Transcript_10694/g.22227  ORF Transcript_10694/g.22227 Transcript_10694/m.22227 type:complete len:123 (+) Transcript_10694:1181-1549(+)
MREMRSVASFDCPAKFQTRLLYSPLHIGLESFPSSAQARVGQPRQEQQMGIMACANNDGEAKQFLRVWQDKLSTLPTLPRKWQDSDRNAFDLTRCIVQSKHPFTYLSSTIACFNMIWPTVAL